MSIKNWGSSLLKGYKVVKLDDQIQDYFMTFTRWTMLNTEANKNLKPDLGIRGWGKLNDQEKNIIWQHLNNKGWFVADELTYIAVYKFSEEYKARSFCTHLLAHGGPHNKRSSMAVISLRSECCHVPAKQDAQHIFLTEHQDVVYELLSFYCENLDHDARKRFTIAYNDLSNQFGLNVLLTSNGLILRQDPKIVKHIYEPTLKFLANEKWGPVGRELDDAFRDYLKSKPETYSSSITHAVASLQAFLQILVNGEVGKGEIAVLLKQAREKNLIPTDQFTVKIFKDIVSVLMSERQSKGDPHPKSEYGNEKTARLLLNLVMVFIQHCLQK